MLLRDDQWVRVETLLQGKAGDRGRSGANNRLFIEAVLWIARTGSPWRDLPAAFGPWNSIYVRFARWADKNVWQNILAVLGEDADFEEVFIDSTIVRAHQHAAGAAKKKGKQALGRSRGGLTTKIHACVEGLGQLARFTLTGGQVADITQAQTLGHLEYPVISPSSASQVFECSQQRASITFSRPLFQVVLPVFGGPDGPRASECLNPSLL